MKAKKPPKLRVFLVDDHPSVRDGVRSFLVSHSLSVVGEASDAEEALRKVKRLRPDVVVLDITLPTLDGGELARRLRRLVPKTRLLAFSIHSSVEYVVRMARCGVHGYVMKHKPTVQLLDAINHVCGGGLFFPSDMADAILVPESRLPPARTSGVLTARELEVLTLLSEGLANKQVARRLGISVRTAETHRERLSHKLNILTVAGLTRYAIQHGLTTLAQPAEG